MPLVMLVFTRGLTSPSLHQPIITLNNIGMNAHYIPVIDCVRLPR